MLKKLTVLIVLAILLTILSAFLFQRQAQHTLTNLGPLDDPICINTVTADKGFPVAWQQDVTSCSENDAHRDVGVFDKGTVDFIAFIVDALIYFVILFLLLITVPLKGKKHL